MEGKFHRLGGKLERLPMRLSVVFFSKTVYNRNGMHENFAMEKEECA